MIENHYYQEHDFILTIFYSDTTAKELHELIDKLLDIEHDTGGMRGLTILSKEGNFKGTGTGDIMGAGEKMRHAKFRKNGKNAIVAESLLGYGLARMYKVASDIMNLDELNIYKEHELDKAIEWLGVEHLKEQIEEVLARCRYSATN